MQTSRIQKRDKRRSDINFSTQSNISGKEEANPHSFNRDLDLLCEQARKPEAEEKSAKSKRSLNINSSTQSNRSGKEEANPQSNTIPSTQSIRSGKDEANPQSFAYFSFLFAVVGIITFLLGAVRPLLRQNPSLFKDHGGVFTIMIIVSACMSMLSSFVLVLSSFLLKNWMKNIHYTILKTIGSFSAILVLFSLGAAVFVPSGDLNWITYTDLCVIFGVLLYMYSFIWKVACAYHPEKCYDRFPVHWAYLLIILVPPSISLLSFFSPNLMWLATVFVSFSIIVPSVIAFMRFYWSNSPPTRHDTSNKKTF